jgi:hypothetical protein
MLTTRHPSNRKKVDTKFRQQVVVAQSVYLACILKATEFFYIITHSFFVGMTIKDSSKE